MYFICELYLLILRYDNKINLLISHKNPQNQQHMHAYRSKHDWNYLAKFQMDSMKFI